MKSSTFSMASPDRLWRSLDRSSIFNVVTLILPFLCIPTLPGQELVSLVLRYKCCIIRKGHIGEIMGKVHIGDDLGPHSSAFSTFANELIITYGLPPTVVNDYCKEVAGKVLRCHPVTHLLEQFCFFVWRKGFVFRT